VPSPESEDFKRALLAAKESDLRPCGDESGFGALRRQLVQGLLGHGLVDELRLMVFPVVLGSGKRLFGPSVEKTPLKLTDSMTVGDGIANPHLHAAPCSVMTHSPRAARDGTWKSGSAHVHAVLCAIHAAFPKPVGFRQSASLHQWARFEVGYDPGCRFSLPDSFFEAFYD